MRIRHAEIVESVMPKEDPNWRFALGGTATSEGFVLRLTADDGTEGYGFCASAFHCSSPHPIGFRVPLNHCA